MSYYLEYEFSLERINAEGYVCMSVSRYQIFLKTQTFSFYV